jgi:hypothetical protein
MAPQQIAAAAAVPATAPVAVDQSPSAQRSVSAQTQIDSLQQQIRELKDLTGSSAKETASVPADQKPF